jgi:hypothetical protein
MEKLRFGLFSVLALAACDTTPTKQVDLSMPDLEKAPDIGTAPDMSKAPPGCFAILGGASQTKITASTKAALDAFNNCLQAHCGSPQVVDGGNAALPCATLPDGGPSMSCDICFTNIQVNSMITFTDPNTMQPIACKDYNGTVDTAGPNCMACGNEIVACVLDCNSDKDCAGLTSGGNPTTCVSNQCQ